MNRAAGTTGSLGEPMSNQYVFAVPVAAALLAVAPAANATSCVWSGVLRDYTRCLADEVTALQTRLDALEADAVRVHGANPVVMSMGFLAYEAGILTYNAPDGVVDTVDLNGMVDGEVRVGVQGRVAVEDGVNTTTDSVIYLNLDSASSYACAPVAYENDRLRKGLYYATDSGNHVTVWGASTHTTLLLAWEGQTGRPMVNLEEMAFVCF
jgi:hypothetical protein